MIPPMVFPEALKPGLEGRKEEAVTEKNTALALGSGGLPVYATPALIALMEGAAVSAADPLLGEGFSTVGTAVEVRHIAASPLGMKVRARAELREVDGLRLVFDLEAHDGAGKIGEGRHERFIVEEGKFLARAAEKKKI